MRDYVKNIGSSKQQACTTYILVPKKSPEDPPPEGVKSDEIRTVSAIGSQNENLTRSLGIDVNSLVIPPTVNEYSDFENNSLEMKSQLTRDTTRSLQSRQIDNQQLADLGSFNDYLAHRRRVVIDRLMALLEEWLENNPAFTRHTQGGSASPSRSVTSGQGSSYSTGSHNTRGPTRSKRSLQSDGSDGSEDNGDENGEGKRNNKRSRVSPPNTRKLACPFFKNDSSKHEHKQACTGPGWGNISRVKHVSPVLPGLEVSSLTSVREHIYRCHWQPHKCHRCYDAFESAEAFEAHQRQDEPCRKRSPKHDDGISQAQYFHLKKKPQSTAKTDRERWEEVYRIIFPEAQEMPSPYYEYKGRHPQDCDDETLDFGEYVREELPQRVRSELEDRCNEFDNGIRTVFVDIVQTLLGDMVKQFNEQRHPAVSSDQGPKPKPRSTQRTESPPASESPVSNAVPDPNVGEFISGNFSQFLSSDSHLSFSLDDYGEITDFDCQLDPLPAFDQPAPILHDSAYGSKPSSTGSPTSFMGY